MSGIELGNEARRLFPAMKIMLASGYAASALKDQMGGADDFHVITKPYTMAQILRQLR
jgi:hypothetical protein